MKKKKIRFGAKCRMVLKCIKWLGKVRFGYIKSGLVFNKVLVRLGLG